MCIYMYISMYIYIYICGAEHGDAAQELGRGRFRVFLLRPRSVNLVVSHSVDLTSSEKVTYSVNLNNT